MDEGSPEVTPHLLGACSDGNLDALSDLMDCVYGDLRRIAVHSMRRENVGHTLQPTALVHELWLQIARCKNLPSWEDAKAFFGWVARVLGNFLVDHARHKDCLKAGGGHNILNLDGCEAEGKVDPGFGIVDLRDGLRELSRVDEVSATVLGLYSFSDLTHAEIGGAMGLTRSEVRRSLSAAGAWVNDWQKG